MLNWWKRAAATAPPVVTGVALGELLERLLQIKTCVEETYDAMDSMNLDNIDVNDFEEALTQIHKAYAMLHCLRVELKEAASL
jgi:hypothetical protein